MSDEPHEGSIRFEWGDAYTLAELAKRFETGPAKWAAPAQKEKTAQAVETMKDPKPEKGGE